jgi:3-methylfumaryl-CoA hydratase
MGDEIALPTEHIGDKVVDEDVATAAPVRAMIAAFDRDEAPPGDGEQIPVGWHGVYFLPTSRPGELGADGLPLGSGVVPDMPFPRRMYAGARMRFEKPIRVGDPLTRETELTGMTPKSGATGRLAIVTVTHRIVGPEGLCVEEDRVTVFREETKPGANNAAPKPADPPDGIVWRQTVTPNEVILFRYSALTFNPHRIHYDAPYASAVEGYPGLVVHGPLSQTYLVNFVKDSNPGRRLVEFDMRARAPLFVNQPIELVGRPGAAKNSAEVWALTPSGGIAMSATARFEA